MEKVSQIGNDFAKSKQYIHYDYHRYICKMKNGAIASMNKIIPGQNLDFLLDTYFIQEGTMLSQLIEKYNYAKAKTA